MKQSLSKKKQEKDEIDALLKRLKQARSRGTIQRVAIDTRLIGLKKRGIITQEQCNEVMGITPTEGVPPFKRTF